MFVDLFQKGIRTAYRTLGARELGFRHDGAQLHSFRFDPPNGGTDTRPIVFLHGLGDASTTWYRIVRPLRERAPVIALDLPPFGLSDLESAPYMRPEQQARAVGGFLDQHVDGPVTLVGQSMGGWTAQWVAALFPDLVDQVVLVSPAGAPLEGSLEAVDLLTPDDRQEVLVYFDNLWYDPPFTLGILAKDMLDKLHAPEVQGFLDAVTEEDLLSLDTLGSIETPALVVWGRHDGILDPDTPAWLARHWGGPVERSYLARAGHMPHIERPRTFVRRLTDFTGLA